MNIYLMQHGLARTEEEDSDRPLSPAGRTEMETGAQAIKNLGIQFDLIVSSRRTRSQQTAAIVAEATGYALGQIVMTESVKPSADAGKFFSLLEKYSDKESVLIVGHLPSLGLFAGQLLTGAPRACIDFQHGGLGRIDTTSLTPSQGLLRYYLGPEHLALRA